MVDEEVTITKDVTIDGNGVQFKAPVVVNDAEVVLNNAIFTATGASASDTNSTAIKVSGTKPFTLKNSTVNGTTRTAVSLITSGKITVENNTFDGGNSAIYNMIEFSIGAARDITEAVIKNNTFVGTLKNNAVSFYNFADGAKINISGNTVKDMTVNSNFVRLSNPKNASVTFTLNDNTYTFSSDTPDAQGYTGFMLLQDYSKSDSQDFSKFKINFKNLKRGTKVLTENGTGLDQVFYVYADGKGILASGVNDPVVTFK